MVFLAMEVYRGLPRSNENLYERAQRVAGGKKTRGTRRPTAVFFPGREPRKDRLLRPAPIATAYAVSMPWNYELSQARRFTFCKFRKVTVNRISVSKAPKPSNANHTLNKAPSIPYNELMTLNIAPKKQILTMIGVTRRFCFCGTGSSSTCKILRSCRRVMSLLLSQCNRTP